MKNATKNEQKKDIQIRYLELIKRYVYERGKTANLVLDMDKNVRLLTKIQENVVITKKFIYSLISLMD